MKMTVIERQDKKAQFENETEYFVDIVKCSEFKNEV